MEPIEQFSTAVDAGSIIGDALYGTQDRIYGSVMDLVQYQNMKDVQKLNEYLARHPFSVMMEDIAKSGYNPLLALGGKGASTIPSAGMQSNYKNTATSKMSMSNAVATLKQAQTAKEVGDSVQELNREKSATEMESQWVKKTEQMLNRAMRLKIMQDRETSNAQEQSYKADAVLKGQMALNVDVERLRKQYQNYKIKAQSEIYKGVKGKVMSYAEWLMDMATGWIPAARGSGRGPNYGHSSFPGLGK